MSWRRALLIASAVLPAIGAWAASRATADATAVRIAGGVRAAAALIEGLEAQDPPPRPIDNAGLAEPPSTADELEALAEPSASSAHRKGSPHGRAKHGAGSPTRRGVLARRSAVLAAVKRGVRPSAAAVGATSDHPAGLLVTGWGAAGTGFRDGDLIISVGGRTPRSVDDVISAVAGAYRQKVYAVSGKIWRNGEILDATVELPIPRDEWPAVSAPDDTSDRPLSENGQRTPRSIGGPKVRSAIR